MDVNNIKQMDQKVKWALVIVSLLTLAALIIAAVTENILAPWRMIRLGYVEVLNEKATDDRGRAIADQFEIRIVQNYLPTLEAVDRCVTCHPGIDDPRMKDERQPYKAHSGEYLTQHPSENYGCTICHRGQGRALVFEEAKGEESHWDYPLLPINLTQSACGLCHSSDEVKGRGGDRYALGKELFTDKGCYSCHNLYGVGGNMGPALDSVGLKIKQMLPMLHVEGPHTLPQWLKEHFEDPQKVVVDSQMKPPQLSDEEIEALTTYMLSLQQREISRTYLTAGKLLELYKQENPEPASGEELYVRYCSTCHDTGEYARYDKFYQKFFPAVRGSVYVQIASRDYLKQNIALGRPGTLMPAWEENSGGLTENEIDRIIDYMLDVQIPEHEKLDARMVQGTQDPAFKVIGDQARGKKLFTKHCSACHLSTLAPDLFNATFQQSATDGFVFTTILKGRENTPMPGFFAPGKGGMGPEDISDLTAYIRNADQAPSQSGLTFALPINKKD